LLLYCDFDDALGLNERVANLITNPRTGKSARHRSISFLRQCVLSRFGCYDDIKDADRLCRDPVMHQHVRG